MVRDYKPGYFHNLAHRLLNDPKEEISGALEDVANKSWQELHKKEESVLEAEIKEVNVKTTDNSAEYRAQVRLPESYQTNEYNTATKKEDADPETSHTISANVGWHKAKIAYEKQMEEDIKASVLRTAPRVTYKDGNERIAAKNYSMVHTFLNFIIYNIKFSQGI